MSSTVVFMFEGEPIIYIIKSTYISLINIPISKGVSIKNCINISITIPHFILRI